MKFSTLHRIYITSRITKNQTLTLENEIFHYCKSVLRMKVSEEFRLFNHEDGEYKVKIIDIKKGYIEIIVGEKLRNITKEKTLILGLCIIKLDRFIEAIKASIQLGVTEIIPIISGRTQLKNINKEKVTKCIIESTEQSERLIPAILHSPVKLEEFCNMAHIEQIIFANEEEFQVKINHILDFKNNIAALIGPEGGFTQQEKERLKQNIKVISISLGNNVLRSEVASTTTLACINLMRN